MMVLHISRDGLSVTARASSTARLIERRDRQRRAPRASRRLQTFRGVVGEPAFNVTVDGDAVVIIERHQFAQFQGTGQEHTS
jgi:hypothetical protein